MAWGRTVVSCGVLWLAAASLQAAELVASKTFAMPQIDGIANDEVWQKASEITVTDGASDTEIKLRALHDGQELFLLAQFADEDESRAHKPLSWNKAIELYETGDQREDTLVLKWNMTQHPVDLTLSSDLGYRADVWFWKAYRTDPTGYADDKVQNYTRHRTPDSRSLTSQSGQLFYLTRQGDQGEPAYKAVLRAEYEGDLVDGYRHQTPTGSRGDIQAKGHWDQGVWTVEFRRKLDTGHSDDLQLAVGQVAQFAVSRYEIAGRPINTKLSQPLYGAGEVSEVISLTLEP